MWACTSWCIGGGLKMTCGVSSVLPCGVPGEELKLSGLLASIFYLLSQLTGSVVILKEKKRKKVWVFKRIACVK